MTVTHIPLGEPLATALAIFTKLTGDCLLPYPRGFMCIFFFRHAVGGGLFFLLAGERLKNLQLRS